MEQLVRLNGGIIEGKRLFLKCLEDIRISGNVTQALLASRLKRTTVYRWRKEDKEFAKGWDLIVKNADNAKAEFVEYKLLEAARRGSVRAQIFILKNLNPAVYNSRPFCNNCKGRI